MPSFVKTCLLLSFQHLRSPPVPLWPEHGHHRAPRHQATDPSLIVHIIRFRAISRVKIQIQKKRDSADGCGSLLRFVCLLHLLACRTASPAICIVLAKVDFAVSWWLMSLKADHCERSGNFQKFGDRSASPPDSSLIWGSSGQSGWT